MATQYVIRAFEFVYDDEGFPTYGGDLTAVHTIFQDAASAHAEMQRLTVERWRAESQLWTCSPFMEAGDEFMHRVNAFCVERCGTPLASAAESAGSIPQGLSDGDVLELAQLTGLHRYHVIEVPDDGVFRAMWVLNKDYSNSCLTDIHTTYAPSMEALMEKIPGQFCEAFPQSWQGSFEDLSDTPLLLRQLVASRSDHLAYDEARQILSLSNTAQKTPKADLFALNALLKQQVFDIQKLTAQELRDFDMTK